jgi:hypothetical protein
MKKLVAVALIALFALVLASPAHANSISITVGGWSQQFPAPITPPASAPWGVNGYPGDTVGLQIYTFGVELTPGTTTTKISTLLWTIDYTYGGTTTDPEVWSDQSFTFNASRDIFLGPTVLGPSLGSISQAGHLKATWDNDYLSLDPALEGTSFLAQGFRVVVTPLGLDEAGGSNFDGDNPWVQPGREVLARVEVTAVPDSGATLLLLGCALTGLGALRRRIGA